MSYTIYLLQAVAFVDLLAVGLIVPLVSAHVRKKGHSHIYVGLLGSVYAAVQLGSGPLIGSLSDLKGRKNILILTLTICGIAYTSLGMTPSIYVILALRAILGLFKQTQMLTKALVADYIQDEQKQSEVYGKMAAISGVGMTLGPIIGGHIAEDNPETGFKIIAFITGACFAINSVLVSFLPNIKKHPAPQTSKQQTEILNETNPVKMFFMSVYHSCRQLYNIHWSKYWDIFLFKALITFAMSVYYSNYSMYLKTEYDLSPKYIGYVISFQGVVGSITSFFIGFINSFYEHDKDYSIRNFYVFLTITIALIGMMSSYNVLVYCIWLIPLAFGNATGRLVTLEMILKRCDETHRGTLIGASNSVRSLTGVIAPMISGLIGEYYGVRYIIYASLFSAVTGLILSYRNKVRSCKDLQPDTKTKILKKD